MKPNKITPYSRMTGAVYDQIYANKNYGDEADRVMKIIAEYGLNNPDSILEAACGTGTYLQLFAKDFQVAEGFDLSVEQVTFAKKKLPGHRIIVSDMCSFDMGRKYDVVVCLFSSIGYVKTKKNLVRTIQNFAKHTNPGGLIIVEPWLREEDFIPGHVSLETTKDEKMTIARMGLANLKNGVSILEMHHMIGTSASIEHFVEIHELAMFTDDDFREAFIAADLNVEIDPIGLTNRRLCIARKPFD